MGRQQQTHLGLGEWLELVDEPDARVELRVSSKPLLQPRHAHQDQAKAVPIGQIAQFLQRLNGKPVRLIHDDKGTRELRLVDIDAFGRAGRDRQSSIAEFRHVDAQAGVDGPGGVADPCRVEERLASGDLVGERWAYRVARAITTKVGEAGELACGPRFADAGAAVAYADIAIA